MIKLVEEKDLSNCLDVIHRSFKTVAEEFSLTKENCPTNGAFMSLARLQNDYQNGDLMYALYSKNKMVGFVSFPKEKQVFSSLRSLLLYQIADIMDMENN